MESDFKPTIVIDTREQSPLAFKNLPPRPARARESCSTCQPIESR
jgi:hypothetical protein